MNALPASFLAFSTDKPHVSMDTAISIHPEGDAVAILPLPKESAIVCTEDFPDLSEMETLAGKPAYRIAIDARKLAAIAAATDTQEPIILEFSQAGDAPVRILSQEKQIGWIMPAVMPENLKDGLLVTTTTKGAGKAAATTEPEQPENVAARVTTSPKRGTIEIDFSGKPPEDIRTALKASDLGFRYSGRGTKRGVPAKMWYGPDNPHTRKRITELFGCDLSAA